ncbi:uncharacterized protein TNCV_3558581 [Trichonephila clavipes]|uniref:Uncharacterized protein n=1 Tax=Trichonephila clavipes TaxID=2585209 RepID=A0A8X6WCQ1_TRICX|nr:uncharacterized protein TNCV_3558581 [Trichonephila clavipes]
MRQFFFDVAIQPEVCFIAKPNSLMKIGNNRNLVLGPFDESTPGLMIAFMNCQTKLRINHLTAVKSVAILENASFDGLRWSILYEDTLTHNRRCSRRQRIDEADISTRVAVDQRSVNCLEEAILSFTVMLSRYRSSRADITFCSPLPVFRVIRCSSVHSFETRITVELLRCK